jgi:hypothetical protein
MSLNKQLCVDCKHNCHCAGQGFYVNEDFCDVCDCLVCNHEIDKPVEEKMNWLKKQWKKFIDWFFKDFYK